MFPFRTAASLVFFISCIGLAKAVIPSVELTLRTSSSDDAPPTTLLVSEAFYGPEPPVQGHGDNTPKTLVSSPEKNLFLCENPKDIDIDNEFVESTKGTWMVVPRGGCTYEHKTWVAQSVYEAHGIIVYNTLGSKYSFNETNNEILWPTKYHDYDCDNARAEIPSNELKFFSNPNDVASTGNGPYDFETNDPLLTGDTVDNLCKIHDDNSLRNCPSKRCLVAHKDDAANATLPANKDTITVCCAWDILVNPYPDTDLDKNVTIKIPTLFASMEQWGIISDAMESSSSLTISVNKRWRPTFNFSFVVIVLLGGFVASFAAFRSAEDYHIGISKLWQPRTQEMSRNNNANQASGNRQQDRLVPRSNASLAEESLELEPIHALMFLVMSSISLFVLFFFKIYNVAKVMYAFGCSNAFIQILLYPLLSKFFRSRFCRSPRSRTYFFRERLVFQSEDFGDITNWYIVASVIGYSIGMSWLYMALCIPQAGDKYAFYWITQDVLGFCICVSFMGLIQLNSIQVASILLVVAFFYDIFFVFITPYIFKGRSVMIEVATSGGPPKADALWCEKYPLDPDCKGGDPMPMLFSVPRVFDYQGGAAMLGLGDIVLPGLLISFAARLDAARLICALYSARKKNKTNAQNRSRGESVEQEIALPPPMPAWRALLFGGYGYYFVPLVIAYTIGLFMANTAVYVFEMGQPALLYLVPCTLGTIAYIGSKRNELKLLWDGPKVLKQADFICYGHSSPTPASAEMENSAPVTENGNETEGIEEEFIDDEAGDAVPLIPLQDSDADSNQE